MLIETDKEAIYWRKERALRRSNQFGFKFGGIGQLQRNFECDKPRVTSQEDPV